MWQCVSDHRVYLTKVGEMTAKHLSFTMMETLCCTDWKL